MVNKGEFKMNITGKLFLASILALSIAAPVQAQNAQQGVRHARAFTSMVKEPSVRGSPYFVLYWTNRRDIRFGA